MGLDIYLRKCADLEAVKAASEAAKAEKDEVWNNFGGRPYEALTEEEKIEARAKCEEIDKKYGHTGQFGLHSSIVELGNMASTTDPEHMFKLGYYRSSYNEGGIERVLRNLGLPTLYDIFQPNEQYEFKPDWDDALTRVNEAISGYEAHLASPAGKFVVTEIRPMWGFGAQDQKSALDMFMQQMQTSHAGFSSYSNRDGEFFLGGLTVRAVITKQFTPSQSDNLLHRFLNKPGLFMVYDKPPTEDGKEDWYLTALKIVRESIEHVIAQPDRQLYYLVWSG